MRKFGLIKTGIMVMAVVGIITTTTVNVRCEGDYFYFDANNVDEAIQRLEDQFAQEGYTHANAEQSSSGGQDSSNSNPNNDKPKKEPTKACDHTYVETIVKEPTCSEDGEMESKCSKCGDTYKTAIPATGEHTYTSEVTKEATCTETGEMTYTCTVCGDTYTEEISVIDHNYEEAVTKEATCTEVGEKTFTCTMCGDSYTEEIPATGHQEGEPVTTKKPGLFTKGEEVVKCSVCGEVLETRVIPGKYPMAYLYVIIALAGALGVVAGMMVVKKGKKKDKLAKSA